VICDLCHDKDYSICHKTSPALIPEIKEHNADEKTIYEIQVIFGSFFGNFEKKYGDDRCRIKTQYFPSD
jgi:hypothetical protein